MGAHIGLDKSGAASPDHCLNCLLQVGPITNVLQQREPGRGLMIDAADDDDPVTGKMRTFSKSHGAGHICNDCVTKVRLEAGMMADQFETADAILHYDDFARERDERNLGMRTEATFARDRHACIWRDLECCGDLGAGGIELRSRPFDVAAKRAKAICVDTWRHPYPQAEGVPQEWRNHSLLAMHGRKDRLIIIVTFCSTHQG